MPSRISDIIKDIGREFGPDEQAAAAVWTVVDIDRGLRLRGLSASSLSFPEKLLLLDAVFKAAREHVEEKGFDKAIRQVLKNRKMKARFSPHGDRGAYGGSGRAGRYPPKAGPPEQGNDNNTEA